MDDELTLHRETLEIEGDRKLYNFTFDLDGEPVAIDPPLPTQVAETST